MHSVAYFILINIIDLERCVVSVGHKLYPIITVNYGGLLFSCLWQSFYNPRNQFLK